MSILRFYFFHIYFRSKYQSNVLLKDVISNLVEYKFISYWTSFYYFFCFLFLNKLVWYTNIGILYYSRTIFLITLKIDKKIKMINIFNLGDFDIKNLFNKLDLLGCIMY
jgi:hypothetical protein